MARKIILVVSFGTGIAILLFLVIGLRHIPTQAATGLELLSILVNSTYRVCTSGPPACDYQSIQEAMDTADEGDLIQVAEGIYNETVLLNKELTLEGGWDTNFGFLDSCIHALSWI